MGCMHVPKLGKSKARYIMSRETWMFLAGDTAWHLPRLGSAMDFNNSQSSPFGPLSLTQMRELWYSPWTLDVADWRLEIGNWRNEDQGRE